METSVALPNIKDLLPNIKDLHAQNKHQARDENKNYELKNEKWQIRNGMGKHERIGDAEVTSRERARALEKSDSTSYSDSTVNPLTL